MEIEQLVAVSTELVKNNAEKIMKFVYAKGRDKHRDAQIQCGNAFSNYLQSAIEKYSMTKTLLYWNAPVYLEDFYVDLDLVNKDKLYNTSDLQTILDLGQYILVSGTGGIGKSTLLKHLFLKIIEESEFIPIFIELREVNDLELTDTSLLDCIYNIMSNMKFDFEKKHFETALNSGMFIFFFDGFDEVIEQKRSVIRKQILLMTDKYERNYYIVSSRVLSENVGFAEWSRFINLKVNKLTKIQAINLISKLDYNEEIKAKFLEELNTCLYDKYESFASYPLLLTIMLITFDQYSKIPDKIHLFYEEAFHALYSRHDASKGGGYTRVINSDLSRDDFQEILSVFCAISYFKKIKSFNSVSLLNYIKQAKQIVEEISFEPLLYKKDLIETLCILLEDGLEFVFTHRTFQEYFTAIYLSRLSDIDQKRLLNKIWNEMPKSIEEDIVFSLLFEINSNKFNQNFIIPAIEELMNLINIDSDKQKNHFRFLKLIFSKVSMEYDLDYEKERFSLTFRQYPEKYNSLIEFIDLKYAEKYNLPISSIYKTNDYTLINENINDSGNLLLEDVEIDSELFFQILGHSNFQIRSLEFASSLLEHLNWKYKGNKSLGEILDQFPKMNKQIIVL